MHIELQQSITHAASAALGRVAGIPVLHLAPIRALIDEAKPLVEKAIAGKREIAPDVGYQLLKEHRCLRLGLVRIALETRMPIHDHPCNIGVLVVLSGRVVIEQFTRQEKRPRHRTIPLTRCSRRVLDAGDRSEIGPSGPNLHSIASESGALLLSALYTSNGLWARHWYAPVSDEGTHVNALMLDQIPSESGQSDHRESQALVLGPTKKGTHRRNAGRGRKTSKRLRS